MQLRRHCWLMMAGVLLLVSPAWGEESAVRETQAETVSRCLRDLKSTDVQVRRRAALLLGKYPSSQVDRILVGCLSDDDAEIRLGALVSLTENRRLPEIAKLAVFRLLRDPDVHVRRHASSLLGDALGVLMSGSIRGNVRIRTGRMPAHGSSEWSEMRSCLLAGLVDSDSSVRRNVLQTCTFFEVEVPFDLVSSFLSDASVEIRVLALGLASRGARSVDDLRACLSTLSSDPSSAVRLEVCALAPSLGQDGVSLLRGMLKDSDGGVRVCAVSGLCRLGVSDRVSLLREVLFDEGLSGSVRRPLVRELSSLGPEERFPLLKALVAGDSVDLAEEGMRALSRYGSGIEQASFFVPYLSSQQGTVSDLALRGIRTRLQTLTLPDLLGMLRSGNQGAKSFALRTGVMRLKSSERGEFLAEVCLDEDSSIRLQGLEQLGRYRPEGWEELLIASLEDGDPAICAAAAAGLCRFPSKAGQAALRAYLPKCADSRLRVRIESALRRRAFR